VDTVEDGTDWQPYKSLPSITEQLRPLVDVFDLRLVVLFGSSARGRARQDSDLDIGVLVKHPLSTTQRAKLWNDLSRLFQAEVDLTVLNHVEPLLGYQVARDGVLLFESEPRVWEGWKSYAVRQFWDTRKYRDALKEYLTRRAEEMRRASAG
jgi:predicted nucleotidyltransferase